LKTAFGQRFDELLQQDWGSAEHHERIFIANLLIQIIRDAYDLSRSKTFDRANKHFSETSVPVLLASEAQQLSDWLNTHERFPYYCAVIGIPHQEMRKFILEVGNGEHTLVVAGLIKGLKGLRMGSKPRRKVLNAAS